MRARRSLSLFMALGLLASQPAAFAQFRDGGPQLLVTDRDGVMVASPEFVCGSEVRVVEWSRSGQHVLAARHYVRLDSTVFQKPPLAEASLVLWSSATRRAKELWKRPLMGAQPPQIAWITGTEVALVVMEQMPLAPPAVKPAPLGPPTAEMAPAATPEPEHWVYRVDARTATLRALGKVASDTQVITSPTQPVAVLMSGAEKSLRVVGADGAVRLIPFPEDHAGGTPDWSQDGGSLIYDVLERGPEGAKPVIRYRSIDVRSGRVTPLMAPPKTYRPAERIPALRLTRSQARLSQEKTAQSVRPLWLESTTASEEPRVLISADAKWGRLSPREDAVLYVADGAAWVVPLVTLPKAVLLEARENARRAVTISNAKQLGTGLMMYAQDYDETLPGADQDIRSVLMPYVQSEQLFEGFVYTHGGGALAEIEAPAETVLGHIPGPGGRAVLYADGHVKWQRDEGPPPGAAGNRQ